MTNDSPVSPESKLTSSSTEVWSVNMGNDEGEEKIEENKEIEEHQQSEGMVNLYSNMIENPCLQTEESFSSPTGEKWRTHPLSVFSEKFRGYLPEDKRLPRTVRKFYKNQDKLIEDLQTTVSLMNCSELCQEQANEAAKKQQHSNNILIKVTFLLNLVLVASKLVASILSSSLSIISSLMDSAVDLASGLTLWFTAKQMRKSMPYTYPTGRTRLEPIAVIILSVIMASVSVQIMVEAIQTLYEMAANKQGPPTMSNLTIGLVASTIVIKAGLYLACYRFGKGESVAALQNDQLNDTLSNSMALVFSTLSARIDNVPYLKYLDPSGALLIGIYIIYSWWKMGAVHTRNLSGYSANPAFLQKISFICVNHHRLIERLDTVRAVHFGNNFMVEVDIVLPRDMDLHQAHDIGETLQNKIESLENVERAFVHLDYEYTHHPQEEHKLA